MKGESIIHAQYKDLSGNTFGKWHVIEESDPKFYNGRRIRYWRCRCECGTIRDVKEASLTNGTSTSCGCYHSEIMHEVGKVNTTHGMTNTRLYRIYRHMINRCTNKNDIRYENYGGRGISVCTEWNTFESFADWAISSGYSDSLSIDRVDVNEGYSPDNCRWATSYEQSINKSNTRTISFNGKTMSIAEWADVLGMPYKKLWKRFKLGWPPEKALKP